MIDPAALNRVASEYNIPPAILSAVAQHDGGALALSDGMLIGFGVTRGEVQSNDDLRLQMIAQQASSTFLRYGTWEQALSSMISGDPQAYLSQTGTTGGEVYSILGIAAQNPTLGMDPTAAVVFQPRDPHAFGSMSNGLHTVLMDMSQSGGVVSHATTQRYAQASAQVQATASGTPVNIGGTEQYAMPFDRRYDAISQSFGPTSLGMEPVIGGQHFHTGVDYEVPDRSPLMAFTSGRVSVSQAWGSGASGPGWEVTVHGDDGRTYLYGHVSGFAVQDGARVMAGQQIAVSGGAGEPGSGMSDGAHLHFEVHDADGRLVNADPYVQQVAAGAQQHPQASAPPPEKPKAPAAAAPPPPASTDQVSRFAAQLQSLNIDPDHFAQNYGDVAMQRRRLTGEATSIEDYAPMNGMDPAAISQYLRSQPHPKYPVSAGQFNDMVGTALLHSLPFMHRAPYPLEVVHLIQAGAEHKDVRDYYGNLARQRGPAAAGQLPAGPPDNVVQLPQQPDQRQAGGPALRYE